MKFGRLMAIGGSAGSEGAVNSGSYGSDGSQVTPK